MTTESKILTVSYGTFSCTLEGFENPFDTMKAIAEYFRDLAAQDRHFGAEPPPPDAAMLHRLAEREVSRLAAAGQRAEAPQTEALAEALADGPAEPAVTPRILLNQVARRQSAEVKGPDFAVEEDGTTPEPSLQDVIPDGVAAKLARIRRSVNPAAADLTTPASPFLAEPLETDAELAADIDADASAPAADLAGESFEAIPEDRPDVAARLGALIADDEPALAAAPVTEDLVEDIAFEDVSFEEVSLDDVTFEDVSLEAAAEDAVAANDDWLESPAPAAEIAAAGQVDETAEDFVPFADEAADLQETAADSEDLADLAALDGVSLDDVAPDTAVDAPRLEDDPQYFDSEMELEAAPSTSDLAFVAEDEGAALELADVAEVAEVFEVAQEPAAETDIPAEPTEVEAAAVADAETDLESAKAKKRTRRLNSRVVRLHPSEEPNRDPSATRVMDGQSESDEIARLMQQAEEVMAEEANRRRQEALSHLKAAVVSTEADRADLDYEAPRLEKNLNPYRDDLAEAIQPDEPAAPEAAPEVKPTRRKSVSIRPQERPGTIRPGMISPPPLVLVSEQRVDRVAPAAAPAPASAPLVSPSAPGIGTPNPDGQPMVAMRTGRLSGAIGAGAALATSAAPARNIVLDKPSYGPATDAEEDEDLAEDSREIDENGLAAFAENVGAKSMAEMLEAAAAYATCIEKRAQFTRPQLMRRMMASAGGKPVSREDGLRSFGTLLRTGRIEKVTRGHYCLADNSPYLAEARRLS